MLDLIHKLISFIRDPGEIIAGGYPLLALVIFLETGALVFFLPGDSLLVTAGLYASAGKLSLLWLNLLLIPMAIIGDATSYAIGRKAGPAIFSRPKSRFFNPAHLKTAHDFYERHGGKAIIIARFMPLVRTFVPVVAGVGQMPYRRFATYNVVGAAAWVMSMTVTGFVLGNMVPDIGKHIEKVIIAVVFISILPGIIAYLRRKKGPPAAPPDAPPAATNDAAS
jgi:membrane-associated protein